MTAGSAVRLDQPLFAVWGQDFDQVMGDSDSGNVELHYQAAAVV